MDQFLNIQLAGFTIHVPQFYFNMSDIIPPPFSSSFSAECWAIIHALGFIQNFPKGKYLIITNSQSALYAILLLLLIPLKRYTLSYVY